MKNLTKFLPTKADIAKLVTTTLTEDVGSGDLTASLIDGNRVAEANLICREQAILCGTAWFDEVCQQLDPGLQVEWSTTDGETMQPDSLVCRITGAARSILTAERSAINLLQTLSGVATEAHRYSTAVAGTGTRILDTRKTVPGLRLAQKYAVVAGGAFNHRIGLYDGILIKENHIMSAGSIGGALDAARAAAPDCPLIEVEVESLEQLQQALDAGAKRIMLDNFSLEMMRDGVALAKGKAEIEASGNVTMEQLREIALTGVDFISVGALTKHVHAVDFSLRFDDSQVSV